MSAENRSMIIILYYIILYRFKWSSSTWQASCVWRLINFSEIVPASKREKHSGKKGREKNEKNKKKESLEGRHCEDRPADCDVGRKLN